MIGRKSDFDYGQYAPNISPGCWDKNSLQLRITLCSLRFHRLPRLANAAASAKLVEVHEMGELGEVGYVFESAPKHIGCLCSAVRRVSTVAEAECVPAGASFEAHAHTMQRSGLFNDEGLG